MIGSNFITDWFLNGARLCPEFELAAVYSRSEERARALAEKRGAPHAHWTLEALAADDTVDAVYIASPNVCHVEQTLQMLRAGKHVLCEKPMAPSLAEFELLMKTAEENGVILMEAMRSAHDPLLPVIRQKLEEIGPIRTASFSYCQYSSRYDKWKAGVTENAFDPAMQGGALMDIGVYCVHMMVMLLGAPQRIKAEACFLPGSIDGLGGLTAEYAGHYARLTYSKVHDSLLPAEISGEGGTLQFGPVAAPSWAKWKPKSEKNGEWTPLGIEVIPEDMYYEVKDFIAAVQGTQSAAVFGEWSRQAIRVMDAVRRETGIDFRPHSRTEQEERRFL